MSNESHRQGQLPPPPWTASQPEYPPPAQYPLPSNITHIKAQTTQPPPYYQPPAPGMATIQQPVQHPQPDAYRLPHPGPYQRAPEMYVPPPAAPPVSSGVYPAAAPRQRTAIACRYCRRRKIRCSGFESSHDGRCSNCVRFNQDCMFTPVSSQTQAFVPAHAAYPHLRNVQAAARMGGRPGDGVLLYGAHGQPLPPPQAPPVPAAVPHGQENTLPPPVNLYQQPHPSYGRPGPGPTGPPPSLAPAIYHDPVSRKRPHPGEVSLPQPRGHSPSVSNSNSSRSSPQRASQGRRESGTGYEYSEPPTLPPVSAPASGAAYPSQPAPAAPGTFYPPGQQDTRRLSSHSSYSFDQSHNPPPGTNPSAPTLPTLQPPPSSTARDSGSTPPPGQTATTRRSGLSVTDMLVPTEPQNLRSDTDNRMVSALDRRGIGR
ncbi:hypothetical protein DIZ76_012680 [Coccidioides immitis]|nr:hypothetical protein DIZ76_012680 [Coccidioides immitis]